MNTPKKYRNNYSDVLIKNSLGALKYAQLANGIFMQKTTPAPDNFVFLKKRIYITDTGRIVMRLARENIRKERQRLMKYKALADKGIIPADVVSRSYQSWRGYAVKYNSRKTVHNMERLYESLFKGEQYGTGRSKSIERAVENDSGSEKTA